MRNTSDVNSIEITPEEKLKLHPQKRLEYTETQMPENEKVSLSKFFRCSIKRYGF